MTENTKTEHTCFGRIFCGQSREVARAECAACAADNNNEA